MIPVALKRIAAGLTLVSFIGTQITGCLTLPQMQSSITDGMNSLGLRASSDKGAMSTEMEFSSRSAAALFQRGTQRPETIGYTTSTYQALNSRFIAAKDVLKRKGINHTQAEFLELSSSLSDLLLYVDRIETMKAKPAQALGTYKPNAAAYTVQPGQQLSVDLQGFCLHEEFPAPLAGEQFQLEPIKNYFKPEMLNTYDQLIQDHQRSGKSALKHPELQALLWTMRGLKTGTADQKTLSSLSPQQRSMLAKADPAGLASLEAKSQLKASMQNVLGDLTASNVPGISAYTRALSGTPSGQRALTPADMIRDPGLLANPTKLAGAMDAWLNAQKGNAGKVPVSPYATPYTLLDDGVAARTTGTGPLGAHVDILNTTGKPFTFSPLAYALNSRAETQGIAPGNWTASGSTSQVKLQQSSKDANIRDTLIKDISQMGTLRALESLAPEAKLGNAAGAIAKRFFSSKTVHALLQSAPVVGNIINLGMLITGKNLDGSDMSTSDYVMAGIGVVPVAGNIAKLLRPAGTKIFAKELASIDNFYRKNDGVLTAADILSSDSAEYAMQQIPTPDWLSDTSSTAAEQVLADSQLMMPQTRNYIATNGLAR